MLDVPELDTCYLELIVVSFIEDWFDLVAGETVLCLEEVDKGVFFEGFEGTAMVLLVAGGGGDDLFAVPGGVVGSLAFFAV